MVEDGRVRGIVTAMDQRFMAPAVVLTVGTLLGGVIHVGLNQHSGGRAGDAASNRLADRLRDMAFGVGRLKTGTPPRVDARSVDFSKLDLQKGDDPLLFAERCAAAHKLRRQADSLLKVNLFLDSMPTDHCPDIQEGTLVTRILQCCFTAKFEMFGDG